MRLGNLPPRSNCAIWPTVTWMSALGSTLDGTSLYDIPSFSSSAAYRWPSGTIWPTDLLCFNWNWFVIKAPLLTIQNKIYRCFLYWPARPGSWLWARRRWAARPTAGNWARWAVAVDSRPATCCASHPPRCRLPARSCCCQTHSLDRPAKNEGLRRRTASRIDRTRKSVVMPTKKKEI